MSHETSAVTEGQSDLLRGPDRLDLFAAAGRPMRMGTPQALLASDADWLHAAAGDVDSHRARVEYLHAGYCTMLDIYLEWNLSWPAAIASLLDEDAAGRFVAETVRAWAERVPQCIDDAQAYELLAGIYTAGKLTLTAGDDFRAARAASAPLHAALRQRAERDGQNDDAAMRSYLSLYRQLHDGCSLFSWMCGAVANRLFDQRIAEQAQEKSLLTVSILEGMWAALPHMAPHEIAATLAEHLRAHLSGPNRAGSVQIVEEDDRYRLLFDPCGSGGAMRRAAQANGTDVAAESFKAPSPVTWNRTDGVPPYCSHCALNEVISVRRLGYPAWVTEYPDPRKPCGWTVYKSPQRIPERYLTRLQAND